MLWVCEAAHAPVVWSTQVLESLAKEGRPSRAECVMLNKGSYIHEAVSTLDDILRRMQSHQRKKRPMLRPLKLAAHFADDDAPGKPSKPGRKRRAKPGGGGPSGKGATEAGTSNRAALFAR